MGASWEPPGGLLADNSIIPKHFFDVLGFTTITWHVVYDDCLEIHVRDMYCPIRKHMSGTLGSNNVIKQHATRPS